MADKKCLVFETLGKVSDLQISENSTNEVRLSGVFGVCGIKNQNNRVYDKENYRQMVESLQKTIATEGCPGELEHPNSMNINLENVSHKIESIQMNEDGTITGTILLLNTPKGQIAKAIVEGGLPLYISSRGAGTITNEGRVTLSTIKTYDLVGTPGFSQAKLTLKENQTVECLNESLDEGNISWAIVYEDKEDKEDDLLGGSDDEEKDKKKKSDKKEKEEKEDSSDDLLSDDSDDSSDDSSDKKPKKDDDKEEKKDEKKEKKDKEEKVEKVEKENNDNKNTKNSDIDMVDLKNAIDKLTDKVTSLEAELHVAQESLEEIRPVNYDAIENWIKEEFSPNFKAEVFNEVSESIANSVQNWVTEEFAPQIQNWVTEEFAPEVQNWVTEEFAPEVQNWVTEEFAPEVQNWVTEEFAPEVQGWITEEFAPEVQNWITEEYSPVVEGWINEEFGTQLKDSINENVSNFMESQKSARLDEIDSILESLSNNTDDVDQIVKEQQTNSRFAGVYVVENMPAEFAPSWEMLDEDRQDEIVRSSRMYDFTKEGVLESFWSNVDFSKQKTETVSVNENNGDVISNYHQNVVSQMMRLRKN